MIDPGAIRKDRPPLISSIAIRTHKGCSHAVLATLHIYQRVGNERLSTLKKV